MTVAQIKEIVDAANAEAEAKAAKAGRLGVIQPYTVIGDQDGKVWYRFDDGRMIDATEYERAQAAATKVNTHFVILCDHV